MAVISVAEAAVRVRRGRQSLYRMIKEGRLSATQLADGTQGIDVAELTRVFGQVGDMPGDRSGLTETPAVSLSLAVAQAELDATRARLASMQEELSAARHREERLLGLIEGQQRVIETLRLPAPEQRPEEKPAPAFDLRGLDLSGTKQAEPAPAPAIPQAETETLLAWATRTLRGAGRVKGRG